ncbi:MAG: hypothetical protein ACI8UO_006588 [Verrucomicrobiales bacterium]
MLKNAQLQGGDGFMASVESGKGEMSRRKRRNWIRLGVILLLILPAALIVPFLSESETVKISIVEIGPELWCKITNTGKTPALIQGTTAIAEIRGSDRTWILQGNRRTISLASKSSIAISYDVKKLTGVGEFRIRLSRFREPSRFDNFLHWLSRHFPGQENRRKLREKIGPNSVHFYSDWIEVPAASNQ